MLEEPSSGSISTTYLPFSTPSKMTISSSSSDAIPATIPRAFSAAFSFSLANRSSFICCSPWTFSTPLAPRISTRPALLISRWMILAPSLIAEISAVSSPVACGKSCCFSTINSPNVFITQSLNLRLICSLLFTNCNVCAV